MRRPLVINGFMATGKSTVGRLVSERAGRPFVDIDSEVERAAGKSVQAIFQEHGESRFRELENAELLSVLSRTDAPVIAVGGGALLQRNTRLHVADVGVLVCLQAAVPTIVGRLGGGQGRPLANGGDEASLSRLLELRAPAYAEAHESIVVDSLSADQVAERALAIWQRDPLGVLAGAGSYSVEIARGHFEARLSEAVRETTGAMLITDANLDALYGETARKALASAPKQTTFVLTPGEEHKTPASLEQIWEHALAFGADRKTRFIGLGGGVSTDVAGFAAATWMRGAAWISVPTNLQGMVDASVGGKTAVDLPAAKNCVGAFWQPARVLCDIDHLATEPDRGYRGALSEVVKTALIGDAPLLDVLERRADDILKREPELLSSIVRRCIAVKARIVSQDEREGGLRAALNLGHTLGHALEAHGGYGHLTHGEAVSLGLVAAMGIGTKLGVTADALSRRVVRLLSALGLPTDLRAHPLLEAATLISNDKKRSGSKVRFVLTPEPGQVEFRDLEIAALTQLAADLVAR